MKNDITITETDQQFITTYCVEGEDFTAKIIITKECGMNCKTAHKIDISGKLSFKTFMDWPYNGPAIKEFFREFLDVVFIGHPSKDLDKLSEAFVKEVGTLVFDYSEGGVKGEEGFIFLIGKAFNENSYTLLWPDSISGLRAIKSSLPHSITGFLSK